MDSRLPHQHRDGFTVSTDPARLDLDAIHAFLVTAYWCEGIVRPGLYKIQKRLPG
jgi:hypothetical protein